MQEVWVLSLGGETLEKEMATHSNIFAWEIPWTEEPGRLQSIGSQRFGHNSATKQQQQGLSWWSVVKTLRANAGEEMWLQSLGQ